MNRSGDGLSELLQIRATHSPSVTLLLCTVIFDKAEHAQEAFAEHAQEAFAEHAQEAFVEHAQEAFAEHGHTAPFEC